MVLSGGQIIELGVVIGFLGGQKIGFGVPISVVWLRVDSHAVLIVAKERRNAIFSKEKAPREETP
jgi:hypothetical protein